MARRSLVVASAIIVICILPIISIPSTILLIGFSNYGRIEETLIFYYLPSESTHVEELRLNAEVGNIEVQYATAPTNYHAQVKVNVEISGSNIEGKSCGEFFDINWQNISSPIAFSMTRKSDDISSWSIEKLSIIVTLRADIVYDINLTVLEGNAEISVPFAVFVNNIATKSSTGNIVLDFNQCVIGGTITGISTTGNIVFNAYDVEYLRESTWILATGNGEINLTIYQYKEMGADVKCRAESSNGNIFLTYKDVSPNVGAKIETDGDVEIYNLFGEVTVTFEGFQIGDQLIPPRPNEHFSNDFPTNYNYEILLAEIGIGSIYLNSLSSS